MQCTLVSEQNIIEGLSFSLLSFSCFSLSQLLLNNLPEIVKETLMSHSNQGFVNYVKLYFLQNYEVTCTRQHCYVRMQH